MSKVDTQTPERLWAQIDEKQRLLDKERDEATSWIKNKGYYLTDDDQYEYDSWILSIKRRLEFVDMTRDFAVVMTPPTFDKRSGGGRRHEKL